MKKKNKVIKLNDRAYEDYIKLVCNGDVLNVPEITEVKKD